MKNLSKIIAVVAGGAVLVGLVVGGIFLANSNTKSDIPVNNEAGSVFLIDDRAVDKDEVVKKKENPLSGRNVFFAGYVDEKLTKTSAVALENLPENEEFLMKYTITNKDTNEVVFETDLIASGQCVAWVPGETLEAGVYNLEFLASPYYQQEDGTFLPLTAGCNSVTYTITE